MAFLSDSEAAKSCPIMLNGFPMTVSIHGISSALDEGERMQLTDEGHLSSHALRELVGDGEEGDDLASRGEGRGEEGSRALLRDGVESKGEGWVRLLDDGGSGGVGVWIMKSEF
jgi:hypothetical protein